MTAADMSHFDVSRFDVSDRCPPADGYENLKRLRKRSSDQFREILFSRDQLCPGAREDNTRPGDKVSKASIKTILPREPRPATRRSGTFYSHVTQEATAKLSRR